MDANHCKMRVNVEGDRLSNLSDDLIHKIFSSFDIKDVIKKSVLSSRWRYIWTSMPYLSLSTQDFSKLPRFSKFATNFLSRRNNLIEVCSLKLTFRVKVSSKFVKRILNYAFSHNIQQLNAVYLLDHHIELPISLFSSESLKHLSLTMQRTCRISYQRSLTTTWEMPALTTLELHNIDLSVEGDDNCVDIFSKCVNLKNLTLNYVSAKISHSLFGPNSFSIIHPRLSNLTLEKCWCGVNDVNVAAPQLKKLTIRSCFAQHSISAPDLTSLVYSDFPPLQLSTECFHSLETAHISIIYQHTKHEDALLIISLLQLVHNVKLLTLNLEAFEFLSSSTDLILPQPSPFVHLRSLKISPFYEERSEVNTSKKMLTKLKSYLLDSSPGSTFTMVSREEIIAPKMMAELEVILKEEKDNIKTISNRLERGKALVGGHKQKAKKKREIVEIKSGWEDLGVRLRRREKKACLILSKLQDIKGLLKKLPASIQSEIQPCFSSLCAEADNVISQITDCMKMQCDQNQSLSSVHCDELATTSDGSS